MALHTSTEDMLRRLTGNPTASFRPGQREAIERLVDASAPVLVVQRTGWGKSAVYFLATRLIRDRGGGPTLLISPLLALMRNQLEMARRLGITAHRIDSTNRESWDETTAALKCGLVDLLLISPERLNNLGFRRDTLPQLAQAVGLLVVDEAHCISDWGHDFRPDYRRISRVLKLLPPSVPVLCTTATANKRVVDDIAQQIGGLEIIRGPLDRPSLRLAVVDLPSQADRLAWLAQALPQLPGSGIVYCLTVDDTERVASWLRSQGIDAVAYSGRSDNDDRVEAEQALLANGTKALVATSALGMGFDKPDLSFVIHYQSPGSPIAYYQQVGRAGRALDRAEVVLLMGGEDTRIQDHFITTAFPPEATARGIVGLLEMHARPLSASEIEQHVNVRHSRLESMLKVLEVEGAVERVDGGWRRTLAPWSYDAARVAEVTKLRRDEQEAMRSYGRTSDCRMAFLLDALDDDASEPCGRCDNCTGELMKPNLDPELVAAAHRHLRSRTLTIEPRRFWTATGDASRRAIPAEHQLRAGRALSRYGDGGWGDIVRRAKYDDRDIPDELVRAAADAVHEWCPDPWPTWITCTPSTSNPGLVEDFARRLATVLGLEFRIALERIRPGPPQKEMENSAQQLRNVRGAFRVVGVLPPGAVLLVDDVVDSRWTLTTLGVALREAGSGPVHPFVLAKAVSS